VLAEKGADKFMGTYYVGYGHKSIGDCGTATVFVENISMLASKAIQDWRLYSGQESSTRYIDFAQQPFINPAQTDEGETIQNAWRSFYLKGIKELIPVLKERYPLGEGEKETTYDKAIEARAFDTMRSFLPAGASTNIAWHMNLRQFSDALLLLRHHPLPEVQEVALAVEEALIEHYPNSFSAKRYEETEAYNTTLMSQHYYSDATCPDFECSRNTLDTTLLKEYKEAIQSRPPKTELPRSIAECGTLQFRFLLDFGSFRDIQRHRAVLQRMPLLTTAHGFHEWYLSELPEDLRSNAEKLIEEQTKNIQALELPSELTQYYIPMGFKVPNRLTGDLHALTYLAELRSTRFVHPTLRERAIQMARFLEKEAGMVLHLDDEPDRFDVKRGEHDIVKK